MVKIVMAAHLSHVPVLLHHLLLFLRESQVIEESVSNHLTLFVVNNQHMSHLDGQEVVGCKISSGRQRASRVIFWVDRLFHLGQEAEYEISQTPPPPPPLTKLFHKNSCFH